MKNKLPEAAEAAGEAAKEMDKIITEMKELLRNAYGPDAEETKEILWQAIDGIQAAIIALEKLPNEVSRGNLRFLRKIETELKNEITEINEQ